MQQNAIKEKEISTVQLQLKELSELIKLSEIACLERRDMFVEFKKRNTIIDIDDISSKTGKTKLNKRKFNPKLEYIFYIICLTHFNLISLSVLGAYFKIHKLLN